MRIIGLRLVRLGLRVAPEPCEELLSVKISLLIVFSYSFTNRTYTLCLA